MSEKKSMTFLLKEYFEKNPLSTEIDQHDFYVVRTDGIVLFSNSKDENSAVGALMGGAWHAMEVLWNNLNLKNENKVTLNFGDSANGLYVQECEYEVDKKLFAYISYKDTLNPGSLRQKVKMKVLNLEEFLKEQSDLKVEDQPVADSLFSQITDAEMDNLFNI